MMKQKGSSRTPCQGSAGSPVDLPCSSCRSHTGGLSPSSQELCPQRGRAWGHQAVILGCWQNLKSRIWKQVPSHLFLLLPRLPVHALGLIHFLLCLWLLVDALLLRAAWRRAPQVLAAQPGHTGLRIGLLLLNPELLSFPIPLLPSPPSSVLCCFCSTSIMTKDELQLDVSAHGSVNALSALWTCLLWMLPLLQSPSEPYSLPQHRSKSPVLPNYYSL